MAPARRSGRERKSSQKYNVDPFQGLDLGSDISDTDPVPAAVSDDEDEAYDQPPDAEVEEVEEEEEDEEQEDAPVIEEELAEESESAGEIEEESEGDSSPERNTRGGLGPKSKRPGRIRRPRPPEDETTVHIRGTGDILWRTGKREKLVYGYGPSESDTRPILTSRSRWFRQLTLPSYKVDSQRIGGLHYNPYYTQDIRKEMMQKSWKWYEQGGSQRLQAKQHTEALSRENAARFMPPSPVPSRFLLGPIGNQSYHALKAGASMNVAPVWRNKGDDTDMETDASSRPYKNAWMLNLGGKIQYLEWLPSQPGTTQYLSVIVYQRPDPKDGKPRSYRGPNPPAFTPSPPSPASIQIWALEARPDSEYPLSLAMENSPRLALVICTDWGYIRQIKWCPALRNEPGTSPTEQGHLGLLAGVWSDGKVRVLDVRLPDSTAQTTQYIHVKSAAFEAEIPDSLITCVSWVSSTSVGVGSAHGSVAIWSIAEVPATPNPRPWFYEDLHESYILSITSGYPSRPNLIASSSTDGFARLTDIRSPTVDTCTSARSRVGPRTLVWYECSQCFLSADENYTLTANVIRRFFMTVSTTRVEANILAVTASPVHSSVLLACADGKVIAVNPIRRIMDSKVDSYWQIWFAHEWRRPVRELTACEEVMTTALEGGRHQEKDTNEQEQPQNNQTDQAEPLSLPGRDPSIPSDILDIPLSRITESYKIAVSNLSTGMTGAANSIKGSIFATIHESMTGATAVAWNPNLHVGGWAAAGVGAGLVRVEDISVEN